MASTYSNSLRIQLIGTGDQSGVWGTTTNTNLGTLIEQAITGVQSIVLSGSTYTLSSLNGISDEARNAVLLFTGSLSSNCTVIAPAANKVYIVQNSTTGGQNITMSLGSGSTIVVPNGQIYIVYTDGTNFYSASTGTFSPAFTGIPTAPTAAAGTNTTQIATTAFVTSSPTFIGVPIAPTAAAGTNTTQLSTTEFVTTALQSLYPIGSIYSATVATNPATLFGFGTWVAFGAGRVLIGDGGGFTAGATGGSLDAVLVSHTHTATSTVTDPGHSHVTNVSAPVNSYGPNSGGARYTAGASTATAVTGITVGTSITTEGVSGTNANLQPYVVVYMWNRTA
jgi:hypothetical protein